MPCRRNKCRKSAGFSHAATCCVADRVSKCASIGRFVAVPMNGRNPFAQPISANLEHRKIACISPLYPCFRSQLVLLHSSPGIPCSAKSVRKSSGVSQADTCCTAVRLSMVSSMTILSCATGPMKAKKPFRHPFSKNLSSSAMAVFNPRKPLRLSQRELRHAPSVILCRANSERKSSGVLHAATCWV